MSAFFFLGLSVNGIHLGTLDISQIHGIIVSTNNERKIYCVYIIFILYSLGGYSAIPVNMCSLSPGNYKRQNHCQFLRTYPCGGHRGIYLARK